MQQSPPIVELRNVSFGYDAARPVLRDVSLAIPRGSVVGIMGQSGCGKTTTLRIIMGAYRPSAGSARVLDHDLAALDGAGLYAMRRKMGMLFQFGALFTDLSVYENVAFPMRENCSLPEDLEHDLVMLKLEAVGLRGAAWACCSSSARSSPTSPCSRTWRSRCASTPNCRSR